MINKLSLVLISLSILLILGIVGFTRYSILGSAPTVEIIGKYDANPIVVAQTESIAIGKDIPFSLKLTNAASGVCAVKATLKTSDPITEKVIFAYQNPQKSVLMQKNLIKSTLSIQPQTQTELSSITADQGKITIQARDCSLFGKTSTTEINVVIDAVPPVVSITSTQHYINQGGAGVVTYQVSDDTKWSGVKIGDYAFKGHIKPGSTTNERFAFFVYSYELPPDTAIEILARDGAGNTGKSTLTPTKFFAKEFRHRDLVIDDKFIETKIADIIANTPAIENRGDNLKNYLLVNRELRKINNDFLKELAEKSAPQFLWQDAFAPLGNAAIEASFADYRSYMYNGQKIAEQVHLGFDMAALEHYPILSSAAGKVIFCDYLGIYGNTIVIDHGYGLMSLYGHLSNMDVKVGDAVARGQKIANSGATGLAGGDHLHYSMLIDGVQTNPIEFWDQHWIQDNVYLRLGQNVFADGVIQ